MIIDLNVIADGKQKQDKIGEVIFKMNELGMIDSLDFAELINMVNDNLIILEEKTEFKNKTIITTDGLLWNWRERNEPTLPVIPQFVADWIEHLKKDKSWLSLYGALNYSDRVQGETKNWLSTNNSELFARAWLDGYTIEQPKLLTVIVKDYDKTIMSKQLPEDEVNKMMEGLG